MDRIGWLAHGGPRGGMEWDGGVRPGRPFPVRSRREIDLPDWIVAMPLGARDPSVSTVRASKNVAILKTRAPCVLDQRTVHGFLFLFFSYSLEDFCM
jgi:hypothetical protein